MPKTNFQDPGSSEIISPHISGLQEAVSKLEDVLGMQTTAEVGIPLSEVYISDSDRYRIFQAPAGKRNWVASPAPVIKKNDVVISTGFSTEYSGGAIVLESNALSTDVFTADITYVIPKSILDEGTPINVLSDSYFKATLESFQNDSTNQLPSINITGKTIVNLSGKDGNCEDTSKWDLYGGGITALTLDTANKVFGTNGIKISIVSGTFAGMSRLFSTLNLVSGKYYAITPYIKNGNATNIGVWTNSSTSNGRQLITDTTKFTRVVHKFLYTSGDTLVVDIYGSVGQYAYVDGVMINEITEEEYNDANYEPPAYVDSVQHLRFPTIENQTTGETIVFPTALADGETIEYENGKAIVTETWMKNVALDGSLGWVFHTDGTGFKQVRVENLCPNSLINTKIVTKYDGKLLNPKIATSLDGADQVYDGDDTVEQNLYISIADTDSGWGEDYTPTDDEVDAYFYGWQMTVYGSNEPYNGTGTKQWNKLYCGVGTPYNSLYGLAQVVSGSYTTVVPTVMNDMGYTPYKLHYKFATPRISEIQPNGSISLAEGVNDVEIKSGYVLGEPANPLQYTSGSAYYLNHAGTGSYPQLEPTRLNNKLSNFKNIYKNGAIDTNNWIFSLNDVNAYGTTLAYCAVSNYDTTATYTVDYEILHEKYDCQAQDVTITSNGSLRDSLNTAIRNISSVQEDVGQIRNEELVYKVGSDEEGLRTEATFVYFSGIVSDGVGEITIIFKKAFKDIPKIYPNLNHFNPSLDVALGVRYVTTTSCVLYLYNKYPQTLVNATVAVKIEGV